MNTEVRLIASGVNRAKAKPLRFIEQVWLPFALNTSPLLLLLSQKFLVPPALLFAGLGDRIYRRDLGWALAIIFTGYLAYFFQNNNVFKNIHFAAFVIFTLSIPLINRAIRLQKRSILAILSYLTIMNCLFGIYVFAADVDLSGLRGLNQIRANDGFLDRFFLETTSIIAVFSYATFKSRIIKLVCAAIIATYAIFAAKSIVVISLIVLNLAFPFFLKRSLSYKFSSLVVVTVAIFLVFSSLAEFRPDLALSLKAKQLQYEQILPMLSLDLTSFIGWGGYLPELASSDEQPYQIETQLLMLLLQIGVIPTLIIFGIMCRLMVKSAESPVLGYSRFAIYLLVGLNNPWLFLPTWYLTCQLLFCNPDVEPKSKAALPRRNGLAIQPVR